MCLISCSAKFIGDLTLWGTFAGQRGQPKAPFEGAVRLLSSSRLEQQLELFDSLLG